MHDQNTHPQSHPVRQAAGRYPLTLAYIAIVTTLILILMLLDSLGVLPLGSHP